MMNRMKRVGALLIAGFLVASPVAAQEDGTSEGDGGNGVSKELKDLGREIRESMEKQGEYVGEKLDEWGQESGSWMADRGLQARVKTTLAGVLGAGSVATINVDVTDGVVTLEGELASWNQVARAVSAVRQIEGVRQVISQLRVPGSV